MNTRINQALPHTVFKNVSVANRIIGISSYCFHLTITWPGQPQKILTARLSQKEWVEYGANPTPPMPKLSSSHLQDIVTHAIRQGWDESSGHTVTNLDMGEYATYDLMVKNQRSSPNSWTVQSLTF